MVANIIPLKSTAAAATTLFRLLAAEDSSSNAYLQSVVFREGPNVTRNLADVIHHIGLLHGRQPGVVDFAAQHVAHPAARQWLLDATAGFTIERHYLNKLAVAIGPLPSTPRQAQSESAVLAQHHALVMLAQSDRIGCALGAAVALVLDWRTIRRLFDHAAKRLSIDPPAIMLPDSAASAAMIGNVAESMMVERAMVFGAHQLLNQHAGLWNLLEARQLSRVY